MRRRHRHDAQGRQRQRGDPGAGGSGGQNPEDAARRGLHQPLSEPLGARQPQHLDRDPQPDRRGDHRLPRPDSLPGKRPRRTDRGVGHPARDALRLHPHAAVRRLGQPDEPRSHRLRHRRRRRSSSSAASASGRPSPTASSHGSTASTSGAWPSACASAGRPSAWPSRRSSAA